MKANPRAIAAKLVAKVAYSHRSLTQVLAEQNHVLSGENGSLIKAFCFGAIRFMPRWDAIMDAAMKRPIKKSEGELRALIAIGLYQLLESRIPSHAAISETVEATLVLKKKWAKGLVNALLRRIQREPEWCQNIIQSTPSAQYGFPQWLITRIKKDWPENWQDILISCNQQAPMTLRVNRLKNHRDNYLEKLQQANIEAETHEFAPDAIVLKQAVAVEKLPDFLEGYVSVQDAAPQLSADFLDLKPGHRVLDACAAPGGKTGHMLERCSSIECLALDIDQPRLDRVTENLNRLQLKAELIAADAADLKSWWDGKLFDRILLDAPCSGTGVIRRHPDIKLLRKEQDIDQLAKQQHILLKQLWSTLAPGGRLVYATCSILRDENEAQIERFLKQQSDAQLIPVDQLLAMEKNPSASILFSDSLPATLPTITGWQIAPGWMQMDGFYYAVMLKAEKS